MIRWSYEQVIPARAMGIRSMRSAVATCLTAGLFDQLSHGMLTPTCTKCGKVIPPEEINVANDIAYCRPCNVTYKLSDLADDTIVPADVDLSRPPDGTWHRRDGMGVVIGASQRSPGTALGTLLIALFWNGIVSVFVAIALGSTLHLLGFPVPKWFPPPMSKGVPIGIGMTLFLWLFLTPFILIGLAMIAAFLSSLAGQIEVTIHNDEANIFNGIGRLGFRKRFRPSSVRDLKIETQVWNSNNGNRSRRTNIILELNDGKPIKFGSGLSEERRTFVAAAMRKALPALSR